jgi:transposase
VRLLHAKIVRPFVTGNKTDATDARGIWLAVQQPGVKFVGIKSASQQATLTLHRQRELLVKMRVMQTNALRGLLYEFGAVFAKGRNAIFKDVEVKLESLQSQLPRSVADSLREQVLRIKGLGDDIAKVEQRIGLELKADPAMQRILKIPGVGTLTATAAIATMGQASAFKSGREFCAWLGLVPKQTGSGGKVRLGASPNAAIRTCEPCSSTGRDRLRHWLKSPARGWWPLNSVAPRMWRSWRKRRRRRE